MRKNKKTKKTRVSEDALSRYYSIKYPVLIRYSSEDRVYFAEYPDLPGCMAHGKTRASALKLAEEVRKDCIKGLLESGAAVPVPSGMTSLSGRFVLRMDPALHKRLSEEAEREGRSLNRLVVSRLSEPYGTGETETATVSALKAELERLKGWLQEQLTALTPRDGATVIPLVNTKSFVSNYPQDEKVPQQIGTEFKLH